jgi:hypothetical protein
MKPYILKEVATRTERPLRHRAHRGAPGYHEETSATVREALERCGDKVEGTGKERRCARLPHRRQDRHL